MTSPAIKIHFNVIPYHYRMIHSVIPSKDPPGYHFKINCQRLLKDGCDTWTETSENVSAMKPDTSKMLQKGYEGISNS